MTTIEYDEDSNIICPECGRPLALHCTGEWYMVPCWSPNGELQYDLFDGDWQGSYVEEYICSGCGHKIPAPAVLVKKAREHQLAMV